MSKSNHKAIEVLKEILGSKAVSYQPTFAKAFGSINAAIWLSQGYFWQYKSDYTTLKNVDGVDFFDKTIDEWYEATGLTEEQQRAARKLLKKTDSIKELKIGVPARLHYSIDIEAVVAVIYGYKETGEQVKVDYRCKSRQYTRASSGKFRQQAAVINGDIIKESLESLETTTREKKAVAASENSTPVEEEKENTPPVAPPPPAPSAAQPQRYGFDPVAEFGVIAEDVVMRSTFQIVHHVPVKFFDSYLEAFRLNVLATGTIHHNRADLRTHFFNFARSRYKANPTGGPASQSSVSHLRVL